MESPGYNETSPVSQCGCLAISEVLGIAWQQIAFMAHDADHYGRSILE